MLNAERWMFHALQTIHTTHIQPNIGEHNIFSSISRNRKCWSRNGISPTIHSGKIKRNENEHTQNKLKQNASDEPMNRWSTKWKSHQTNGCDHFKIAKFIHFISNIMDAWCNDSK